MFSRARRLIQVAFAFLVLSSCLTGCQDEGRHGTEELHQRAEAALQRGDLDEARLLASRGLEEWKSQPETLWHWRFRILLSEVLIRNREVERPLDLLKDKIPQGEEFEYLRCRQLLNTARARLQRRTNDDLEVSSQLLQDASQIAVRLDAAPLKAKIQIRRGYLALWQAQEMTGQQEQEALGKSEGFFRDATAQADAAGDPGLQAMSRGSLSYFLTEVIRYSEAVEQYQLALQAAKQAGDNEFVQKIYGGLGWSYYWLGDFKKAKQLLEKAVELAGELQVLTDQHRWLGNLGVVYFAEKNYQEAHGWFRKAYESASQNSESEVVWVGRWLNNLSTTSIRLGHFEEAEQYNQQARELKESLPEAVRRNTILYTLQNSADIQLKQQDYKEAERLLLEILQSDADDPTPLWEARATLGGLYARSGKIEKAEKHFEEALQSFDDVRASLKRRNHGLIITFQERRVEYLQAYVDFLMQNGKPERALWIVESSRAQVLAEGLGRDPAEPGQVASFRKTAQELDAVLLSYWIAPERSYAWAVTPDGGFHAFKIPSQKYIEKLVEAYQEIVQVRNPLKERNPIGDDLYKALLDPLQGVLQGGNRVVLVPHGILHNLNFETIPVPHPQPHYWIEDVTLALAPSLAVIQPISSGPSAHRSASLLVGFSPQDDPLPKVHAEIQAIKRVLEARRLEPLIFMGHEAKAASFEGPKLLDYWLIHFAAHAVANRESPLNSYVTLSDKLYAHTVASTRLAARLVTVSACQSAGAQSYAGEGLVGFTWAFLYAGAHNVVAGLWNVNDRSSFKLMQGFYSNLTSGMHPAGALRQAKIAMLALGGVYSKPYHWAPFQIYTHSSPFQRLFDQPLEEVKPVETDGPK